VRKWLKAVSGRFRLAIGKKILHGERGQALEQAPQGSSHSPMPVGVKEVFGQCSVDIWFNF